MTTRGVLLAIWVGLLGLMAGIVIGWQSSRHRAVSETAWRTQGPSSNALQRPEAIATNKPLSQPREPTTTTIDPARTITIEEVIAAIQSALAEKNQSKRREALEKIARAV